jgi:hypothetical protein
MITDRVTLFGPETGNVVPVDPGSEALVYSPRNIRWPDSSPRQSRASTISRHAIEAAIRENGGIAAIMGSDERLTIVWAERERYVPPARALLLSPAGRAELVDLRDNVLELASGEHVLLPIDREAELKLQQFQDVLQWLPWDRAFVIRQVLRGPSFDWRLAQLERRVERALGPGSSKTASWFGFLRSRGSRAGEQE